ncbi:MAG: hypothetical protein ACT4PO_05675 [Actinomycetota bacterium]
MASTEPLTITDGNLDLIRGAEQAVLVLAKGDCEACAAYGRALGGRMDRGRLHGALVGKMFLDRPGSSRFKRDNPWLRDVEFLPYTLVYRDGVKVDEFASSRDSYLLERLRVLFPTRTAL